MDDTENLDTIKEFQLRYTQLLLSKEENYDIHKFYSEQIIDMFQKEKYSLAESDKVKVLQHKLYWVTKRAKECFFSYCGSPAYYFETDPSWVARDSAVIKNENKTYIDAVTVLLAFFPREIYWLQNVKTLLCMDLWVEFDYHHIDEDKSIYDYTYYYSFNHIKRYLIRKKKKHENVKIQVGVSQGSTYEIDSYQPELYLLENTYEAVWPKDQSLFERPDLYRQKDVFTLDRITEVRFKLLFKRECVVGQSITISNSTTFYDVKRVACQNWKVPEEDYLISLENKQSYLQRDKLFKPVNVNDLAVDDYAIKSLGTQYAYDYFNGSNIEAILWLNFNELSGQRVSTMFMMNDEHWHHRNFDPYFDKFDITNQADRSLWMNEFSRRFESLQFDKYYDDHVKRYEVPSITNAANVVNQDDQNLFKHFKALRFMANQQTNEYIELASLYSGHLTIYIFVLIILFQINIIVLSSDTYSIVTHGFNQYMSNIFLINTLNDTLNYNQISNQLNKVFSSDYYVNILSSTDKYLMGNVQIENTFKYHLNYSESNIVNINLKQKYNYINEIRIANNKNWYSDYLTGTYSSYLEEIQLKYLKDNYNYGYSIYDSSTNASDLSSIYIEFYDPDFNKYTWMDYILSFVGFKRVGYFLHDSLPIHHISIDYDISSYIITDYDYIDCYNSPCDDLYNLTVLTPSDIVEEYLTHTNACYKDTYYLQRSWLDHISDLNTMSFRDDINHKKVLKTQYDETETFVWPGYDKESVRRPNSDIGYTEIDDLNLCYKPIALNNYPLFTPQILDSGSVNSQIQSFGYNESMMNGFDEIQGNFWSSNKHKSHFYSSDHYYLRFKDDNGTSMKDCSLSKSICFNSELVNSRISQPIFNSAMSFFTLLNLYYFKKAGESVMEYVPEVAFPKLNFYVIIEWLLLFVAICQLLNLVYSEKNFRYQLKVSYLFSNKPVDLNYYIQDVYINYNLYYIINLALLIVNITLTYNYKGKSECYIYLTYNRNFENNVDICDGFDFKNSYFENIYIVSNGVYLSINQLFILGKLTDYGNFNQAILILLETVIEFINKYLFSYFLTLGIIIVGFIAVLYTALGDSQGSIADPISLVTGSFFQAYQQPDLMNSLDSTLLIGILLIFYIILTLFILIMRRVVFLHIYSGKYEKARYMDAYSQFQLRNKKELYSQLGIYTKDDFGKANKFAETLKLIENEQNIKFKMMDAIHFKKENDNRLDYINKIRQEIEHIKSTENWFTDDETLRAYKLMVNFINYEEDKTVGTQNKFKLGLDERFIPNKNDHKSINSTVYVTTDSIKKSHGIEKMHE